MRTIPPPAMQHAPYKNGAPSVALGLLVSSLVVFGVAVGCGGDRDAARDAGTSATARATDAAAAAPAVDPGPPKRILAKRFVVHVRSAPNREAEKLGYLRGGAVLQATTAEPVGRDGCPGGWFELTTGGFVCNGPDVQAFTGRRIPGGRGTQPDLAAALPYKYGGVRRESPLYRRTPNDEEAVLHEGYVIPGTEPVAGAEGTEAEGAAASAADAEDTPAPAEAAPAPAPAAPTPSVTLTAQAPGATATADIDPLAAMAEEPEEPTLRGLQGERGSVVLRRMMPGFILSLDRTYRNGARRYWRSQSNGYVPYTRVGLRTGSEFRGMELTATESLPAMFVTERMAVTYTRDARGNFRARGGLRYHAKARVLGTETVGAHTYLDIGEGRFVRRADVVFIEARPRPEGVAPTDKWIDVDLAQQTFVAYEGDRPVYVTLISSGRMESNSDTENFRTPTGTYRITSKHLTTTMDGDSAVDGPYSIEDVPYVMYFKGAYALHTAFWHDRFGHPKSHGCVNMAPWDARHIFAWTTPAWPTGWHGIFATPSRPSTWVIIREG